MTLSPGPTPRDFRASSMASLPGRHGYRVFYAAVRGYLTFGAQRRYRRVCSAANRKRPLSRKALPFVSFYTVPTNQATLPSRIRPSLKKSPHKRLGFETVQPRAAAFIERRRSSFSKPYPWLSCPKTPFMKAADSSDENSFASSTASSMATLYGTSFLIVNS